MRRLRKVIRDERGASLSIALLLFLVCTVVASVVLIAGTTASGRVAELASMDQRYYSVTSAVEFFRDELKANAESPTTKCLTVTETLTFTENGDKYEVKSDVVGNSTGMAGNSATATLSSLLAYYYSFEEKGPVDQDQTVAWSQKEFNSFDDWFNRLLEWEAQPVWSKYAYASTTDTTPVSHKEFTLTFTPSNNASIATKVKVKFANDGSANLTFWNDEPTNKRDFEINPTYTVHATLVPTFGAPQTSQSLGSGGTTVETKTVTMTWELADITSDGAVLS